ncbi:hypothetical protein L5G28_00285 [Gordonia sp. HY285]|uniref:hypothetical protein n=1 Tax=Gordonia liuliyuniae TaxID=2911517 RepID=UPI001F47CF31|nr:hypothetical protein [Gordonia liuliyuniae]MCF8608607.1 hypothetical protein [Gordonia liuliyuniae]
MLTAIGVVAVAAVGTILLVAAPWSSNDSSGPHHESVALDHGVSVDVEVPADWRIEQGDFDGSKSMMLVPATDDRTIAQVDRDGDAMDDGGTAEPIHALIGIADSCGSSLSDLSAGEWRPDTDQDTDGGVQTYRHSAVTRVDTTYCFQIVGIDFGRSTTMESTASDLTQKLLADDAITAAKAT